MGNLLLGADPEFFLYKKVNGRRKMVVPPSWLDKEPFEVPDVGRLVSDGMAAEIHVRPDTKLSTVRKRVLKVMKEFEKETGIMFSRDQITYVVGGFDNIRKWEDYRQENSLIGCDPFLYQKVSRRAGSVSNNDIHSIAGEHLYDCGAGLPERIMERFPAKDKKHIMGYRCNNLILFAGGHIHMELPEFVRNNSLHSFALDNAGLAVTRKRKSTTVQYVSSSGLIVSHGEDMFSILHKVESGYFFSHMNDVFLYRIKPYGIEVRNPSNAWVWDASTYGSVQRMINGIHHGCAALAVELGRVAS